VDTYPCGINTHQSVAGYYKDTGGWYPNMAGTESDARVNRLPGRV
jgi:hypothetical protein